MTPYFATCARGLEPLLARELADLGAEGVEPGRGGVRFRGDHALLYRANLWLRTAVRVLQPVMEKEVHSPDELYEAVRAIDWTAYLTPDHTLAVDCNVRDSAITHSQYAARRVKDAICDQFRDKTGRRPSVDAERPMVGLNLHIHRDRAVLSLDSSWNSLHKRGYRPIQTIAPLNEALAAALILHSGWDPATPLVDPLCGSGTFCIEAAWIALNRAPGLTREWFGFQGWIDFDRPLWNAIRDDARRAVRKELPAPIIGSDNHPGALDLARHNARAAGVGHAIRFLRRDIRDARPPDGVVPRRRHLQPALRRAHRRREGVDAALCRPSARRSASTSPAGGCSSSPATPASPARSACRSAKPDAILQRQARLPAVGVCGGSLLN